MSAAAFVRLIAVREYLRVVRRRGFVLLTLLVPIALVAFVAFVSGVSDGAEDGQALVAPVWLVNESAVPLAATEPAGTFPGIRVVTADEAEAARARGDVLETYLVPADVLERGSIQRVTAESVRPDMRTYDRYAGQEAVLTEYLRGAILERHGLDAQELALVTAPFAFVERTGSTGPIEESGPDVGALLVPYAFALLFVLSIMMTSGYLLQSVTEEKENRVVEIVLTSVPPIALMGGKLLGLGLAGLTQVAVWVITVVVAVPMLGEQVPFLADVSPTGAQLAIAVAYFVLGYLLYGAIYCAAGAAGSSQREATQLGAFAGLFASLPIMLTVVFMQDPGSPLASAFVLFPLTAPAAALQVVSFAAEPPWLLIGSSLVLLAIADVLALVGGARVFRATLLFTGTRPPVRQLAGVLLRG